MIRKLVRELRLLRAYPRYRRLLQAQMYFVENPGQTLWGSISEEDETAIIKLTQQASSLPGPIVEIGALFGFTTQLIANHKPVEKKLIAVENYSWNPFGIPARDHRLMMHRVLRYVMNHCNTSIFEGSNKEFQAGYRGEKPSMVFIDAFHEYEPVKADIDWAVQLGIPIIAGHDYCERWPDVIRAVDETFHDQKQVIGSVWWHSAPQSGGGRKPVEN